MDETPKDDPNPNEFPSRLSDGKDELNLAEFPLCCIADRAQPDVKTLVFEDQVWDASRGEKITRQLTITASDEFGLPTALDDEVLLGLVQLSRLHDFTDRRVYFTRYQLIRVLGWRDQSKSYERIETSLNRWMGVTLYYKNAWWSKADGCWVDEKFHILDNVQLYEREKARRYSVGPHQASLLLSHFIWNEVLFRSFKSGNLKGLDFEFFKSLDSAITKRLFRFLDKRFWHRDRWEFNLKELAWVHVGLSRSYDTANLKRKLRPAIQELERRDFLTPMPDGARFPKVSCGDWRVVFQLARPRRAEHGGSAPATPPSPLVEALVERGVTRLTAHDILTAHPAERIEAQLEIFDWLAANRDNLVSRNPAGFLISSIKGEYAPPKGFVSREERERRERKAAERQRRIEEHKKAEAARQETQVRAQEDAIDNFWRSFSDEERSRLEAEAIQQASSIQREVVGRGGALARITRKAILAAYALKIMQLGV